MTNTMTPSEMADWLDRMSDAFTDLSPAAVLIRELEDDRDQEIRTREATVELLAETEAKLKIATEALEEIGAQTMSMHFTIDGLARHGIRSANEALARIKEVGA